MMGKCWVSDLKGKLCEGAAAPCAAEFRGVSKSFSGTTALRNFSLRIDSGGIYALLGANGAGKTTAMKMLAGLMSPDMGEIEVLGRSVIEEPQAVKAQVAYLPDEPLLYPLLRPLEHLEYVAALWNMPSAAAAARAEDLLRWLELWEYRGKRIETFSRGMKQKLALAAGVLHDPSVILMDEPLTGLDVMAMRVFRDFINDFVRTGRTVILTSHLLDVVEKMDAKVGFIKGGRLVSEGRMAELRTEFRQTHLEDVFLSVLEDRR